MNHTEQIKDTITQLFVHTDNGNWNGVEAQFASKVILDYSSMTGNPSEALKPEDITSAWKTVLPGFTHTHHQIGNFIVEMDNNEARVFCYGTATHYLEDKGGNVWTVVGSYDFDLENMQGDWKITSMTFNFKYMDGNASLIQKAIENVKSGENKEAATLDSGSKNKDSVKAFFKALEDENVDGLVNLFTEDAIHINPYHSGLFPKGAKGKEGIRNYWSPVFPNFEGMSFHIEEIYAMEDPNIIYVKYKGNIRLKNNAGLYSNQYYSTFKFNEVGDIMEYTEIFNPITAARGFGLLDKIK